MVILMKNISKMFIFYLQFVKISIIMIANLKMGAIRHGANPYRFVR